MKNLSENCLKTPNYLYAKIKAHEKSGILIAKAKKNKQEGEIIEIT